MKQPKGILVSNIAVLGDGAWGTAIATLLAHNGIDVTLWCYNETVAQEINTHHTNAQFLPNIILPSTIKATTDMVTALQNAQWVFEAVPVKYMRSVLEQSKPFIKPQHRFVILSKGIEEGSCLLPSQIITSMLGTPQQTVVLSGPSFAHELARHDLTMVNCASFDKELARQCMLMVNNNYFKTVYTADVIGIEVCAALKNVITLAVGIAQGAGCGDNAKAMIITKGLAEMANLVQAMGGKQDTVYSFAGVGDLLLTATGTYSKNLAYGKQIGQGVHPEGLAPEGVNTLMSIKKLAHLHNVQMPLLKNITDVMQQKINVQEFVQELLKV